ncbi:MAG: hypothetical protein V1492_04080 [Candidatus Micrarchaeota archaeon]
MADPKKDEVFVLVNSVTKNMDISTFKSAKKFGDSADAIDRFYPVFLQLNPNFRRYAEEKKGIKPPSTTEEKANAIFKFLETDGGKATADKLFSSLSENENFSVYLEVTEDTKKTKAEQISDFLRKPTTTVDAVDFFYDAFSKTDGFKKYQESQRVPETTEEKRANIINFLKQEASDKPYMGKALAAKYKNEASDLLKFDFKEDDVQVCDRLVILGALLYNRRLLKPSAELLWDKETGPKIEVDRSAAKTPEKGPSKMTVKPAQVAGSALEALNLGDKDAFQSEIKKAASSKEGLESVFRTLYNEKVYSGDYLKFLQKSEDRAYKGLALNPLVSAGLVSKDKKTFEPMFERNRDFIINSTREWLGMKKMNEPVVAKDMLDKLFDKLAVKQEKAKIPEPPRLPAGDLRLNVNK